MIIKDVILNSEKENVRDFLARFNLDYEKDVDKTFCAFEGEKIIGTISVSAYVIKCFAVDENFRGENTAADLMTCAIDYLVGQKIFYYQVFTKPEYEDKFVSLGFKTIVKTGKVVFMEGGDGNIENCISKIKNRILFNIGVSTNSNNDVAAVVINGNPFTEGHLRLVEKAATEHDYVLVFVLEEDCSMFSFKDRLAMAFLALKMYENVCVLPSTKYIVSKSTFPSYFLHEKDENATEYAKIDARVFKDYFMPALGIKKRYVGSENTDYMQIYNRVLKQELEEKLVVVQRYCADDGEISAKKVRTLLQEGKINEAMIYIPKALRSLFAALCTSYDL